MGNKITLTYENGEFNVAINESIVYIDKDMENSLLKFNSVVKNNAIKQSNPWDSIENEINKYNIEGIELNTQFKTINFGKMKYFYNTDKVFYIENNSDKNIIIQVNTISINGFMVDSIMSPTICANKKIVEGLTVLQTDLENNEITELENMEISFKIIDENTWDILYTTEPFVVEF